MSEDLIIKGESKKERYTELFPQIAALVDSESDSVANMANICAALKEGLNFFWVGFYLVKGDDLVLGPFQGPVACTRIKKGKGVCGTSWETAQTIIVEDVDKYPGHIACNSQSKSEIVIPIFNSQKQIVGVLDVDSDRLNAFNHIDRVHLESIVQLLKF